MKAHLDSYLSTTPNSSLNVFGSLYAAQLERMANLELQKFSIDFNSLPDDQKQLFLSELDKALTNINTVQSIAADITKEAQAEAARAEYFASQAMEKLKKEEAEKQERQSMESLSAAIEMAALKTSAAATGIETPGLAALLAIDALNERFSQNMAALNQQMINMTEMLLDKVNIVEDAASTVGNTGYMDENGNMSKTSMLTNVLRIPANVDYLAQKCGMKPNEMHHLKIEGNNVVDDRDGRALMTTKELEDLHRTSYRENAARPNFLMFSSVAGIKLANETIRTVNQELSDKTEALETGIAQNKEWQVAVLKDNGVAVDMSRIDEQLSDVARNAPATLAEQIKQSQAVSKVAAKDLEATKATTAARSENLHIQKVGLLDEIKRHNITLRPTKTRDTSAPNLGMFKDNTQAADKAAKKPGITPEEVNLPRGGGGRGV